MSGKGFVLHILKNGKPVEALEQVNDSRAGFQKDTLLPLH